MGMLFLTGRLIQRPSNQRSNDPAAGRVELSDIGDRVTDAVRVCDQDSVRAEAAAIIVALQLKARSTTSSAV